MVKKCKLACWLEGPIRGYKYTYLHAQTTSSLIQYVRCARARWRRARRSACGAAPARAAAAASRCRRAASARRRAAARAGLRSRPPGAPASPRAPLLGSAIHRHIALFQTFKKRPHKKPGGLMLSCDRSTAVALARHITDQIRMCFIKILYLQPLQLGPQPLRLGGLVQQLLHLGLQLRALHHAGLQLAPQRLDLADP